MEPPPPASKSEISEETRIPLKLGLVLAGLLVGASSAWAYHGARVSSIEGRVSRIETMTCAIAMRVGADVSLIRECQP